jgi:predicted CopG family antitoxin
MAEKLHESGIEDLWDLIDKVLASLNILRIVSNSVALRTWLREYHGISNFDELLEGYKLFLIAAFKFVLHAVATDFALVLKEDDVLFRVTYFVEVNLEDVPHTCEKTVFLKNIWNLSRKIRRAKSWDELDKALRELRPLFEIFDSLYRKSRVTCRISKKEALKGITLLYANALFVDSSNGFPRVFTLTPSTRNPTQEYLNRNFKAYAYTLEYLFFNLLDRDTFEQLKLKEMHNPSKVFSRKTKENPYWKIVLPELEEKSASSAEWYALDNFYQVVETKIIRPFEVKLRRALGLNPLFILAPGSVDKSVFKSLLSEKNLQNPQYLYKKDRESLKKKLDYHLLWYEVHVLDGSYSTFSGVPTFISTLLGLVELNKRYGGDEKVKVKIFKHPVRPGQNYYSFSILISVAMFFSDLSGWLVYYDCATDFSGFGRSLYREAKKIIDDLKSKDLVEVEEISVDKEIFKEYLKERSRTSVFDTISFSEKKRQLEEFLARYKGTIFEYIVYHWLNESKHEGKVKLNTRVGKEEIDCILEGEDLIEMYECKFTLHTDKIDETVDQIKRKVSTLNQFCGKRVVPNLVVYNVGSSEHIKKIKEQGINVIIMREIINENKIFDRKRKDIKKILGEDLDFRNVDELHLE